jgi:hypothetical protein
VVWCLNVPVIPCATEQFGDALIARTPHTDARSVEHMGVNLRRRARVKALCALYTFLATRRVFALHSHMAARAFCA